MSLRFNAGDVGTRPRPASSREPLFAGGMKGFSTTGQSLFWMGLVTILVLLLVLQALGPIPSAEKLPAVAGDDSPAMSGGGIDTPLQFPVASPYRDQPISLGGGGGINLPKWLKTPGSQAAHKQMEVTMLLHYDLAKSINAQRIKEAEDHRLAAQITPRRAPVLRRLRSSLKRLNTSLQAHGPAQRAGTSLRS